MGRASSSKKVARAARAGGRRTSGQRRQLGFPIAVGVILAIGILLVLVARDRSTADAFPRANQDHVHDAYDTYTCVVDTSPGAAATTTVPSTAPAAASDTTSTTTIPGATTTAPTTLPAATTTLPADTTTLPGTPTSSDSVSSDTTPTTIAAAGDVPGEYQAAFTDAQQDVLGIHTHGDGLIHIHPFTDSVAGRNATLGVFLDQVGVSMTNDTLTLPSGLTFKEGQTKCQGGKDGELQVALWNNASDAAAGKKPNQIFTSGFDKIRLKGNQALTIAFMPAGSTIPAKPDVAQRIANVTDLSPTSTLPQGTITVPPASGAPTTAAAPGAPTTAATPGAPASVPDTAATIPPTTPTTAAN